LRKPPTITTVELTYTAGTFYVPISGQPFTFEQTVIVERTIFLGEPAPNAETPTDGGDHHAASL